MICAILDRQHTGKSAASADLGAWADLDGDGRREVWEREASLTQLYLFYAERALRKQGHAVIRMADGAYSARHARSVDYARKAPEVRIPYIAAHLSGSGHERWGLWRRSSRCAQPGRQGARRSHRRDARRALPRARPGSGVRGQVDRLDRGSARHHRRDLRRALEHLRRLL